MTHLDKLTHEQRTHPDASPQNGISNGSSSKEVKGKKKKQVTSNSVMGTLAVIAAISYLAMPNPLQPQRGEAPSIQHVFYYGWLTAISTGLGVLPLVFTPELPAFWVGISNGECASFWGLQFLETSLKAYRTSHFSPLRSGCRWNDDCSKLFASSRRLYV